MNLEKIQDLWQEDAQIDRTDFISESIKIPHLHHKYFLLLSTERLLYKKLESDYKKLKLNKIEFLTMGPTKETQELGWTLPSKGRVIKAEVSLYLDADQDLIDLGLRIAMQEEKVKFLESILYSLNNRTFQIKNAIEWFKLTNGG